ncbi:DUF397 domain-containing protein [Spirillospora sp. CA-108201]
MVWHKSSHSGSVSDCVEVSIVGTMVAVRDSMAPDGPVLLLTSTEWIALLAAVRAPPSPAASAGQIGRAGLGLVREDAAEGRPMSAGSPKHSRLDN